MGDSNRKTPSSGVFGRRERGWFRRGCQGARIALTSITALVPVLFGTALAPAAVTGLDVVYDGVVNGRYVYSVYVLSDSPSDVLLSAYRHNVLSGSMSGVEHVDLGDGSWQPAFTSLSSAGYDSFVTMTGLTGSASATSLDPGFGGGTGSTAGAGRTVTSELFLRTT